MNRVSVMITRRAFSSVFESKAHQEMIRSQFTQQALPFLEFHNEQDVLSVFQQLGQFKKNDRILDSGWVSIHTYSYLIFPYFISIRIAI